MVEARRLLIFSVASILISVGLLALGLRMEPYSQEYHLKIHKVRPDIEFFGSVVELFNESTGKYPDSLTALIPNHIARVRTDPWGNDYVYRLDGNDFDIYSIGRNGIDEFKEGDDVILEDKYYPCDIYGTNCPRSFWGLAKIAFLVLLAASTFIFFGVLLLIIIRKITAFDSHR